MTEKQLQSAVVEAARALGWLAYHTFDSRRSERGFPDLVLVHGPQRRIIFAELKTKTGEPTLEQNTWLEHLTAVSYAYDGVETFLWRPAAWESGYIIETLKRRTPHAR